MQTGYIEQLLIQRVRKGAFEVVSALKLEEGKGIVGDCHYGEGNKQITLLSVHIIQRMNLQEVPGLCFPRFKGNIITCGIDYTGLALGDILNMENAQLEISAYTKECFPECKRLQQELPCELINGIAFARVLRSGVIQIGEKVWMN